MATSQVEQIMAKIKTQLEAVTGTYAPDIVTRTRSSWDRNLLSPEHSVLCLVHQNNDRPLNPAFGEEMRELSVSILCAQQDKTAEQDEHKRTSAVGTLKNAHVKAVEDKLQSDKSLGGLAITLDIADKDYEMGEPAGWIASEMVLLVQYDYTTGTS